MKRLLLVEDDPDAREALARALTRAGYVVTEAGDPQTAANKLDSGAIDLVITDMVLGDDEAGGLAVLKHCKEHCAWHPTIVVSAFAAVPRVVDSMNLGASYFLEKPFATADILSVIERLQERREDFSDVVEQCLSRAKLTEREREVAVLILKGLPSAEIAKILAFSEKTVRQHTSSIYAKCAVSSRAEFFHHVFPF